MVGLVGLLRCTYNIKNLLFIYQFPREGMGGLDINILLKMKGLRTDCKLRINTVKKSFWVLFSEGWFSSEISPHTRVKQKRIKKTDGMPAPNVSYFND